MLKKTILLILLIALLCNETAFAALFDKGGEYTQETGSGEINWSKMVIRVKSTNEDFAEIDIKTAEGLTEKEAAHARAEHDLIETIKEIAISSSDYIGATKFSDKNFNDKMKELVKKAQLISIKTTERDFIEVVKEMKITGELLDTLFVKLEALPDGQGKVFPGKIKYTSIIFDATKTDLIPVLTPYIADDKGDIYFSLNKKNRKIAVKNGAVRYFRTLEDAKKARFAGKTPYIINDIKLSRDNKKDTLIIPFPLLAKVRSDGFYSQIINNCKVIIIVK